MHYAEKSLNLFGVGKHLEVFGAFFCKIPWNTDILMSSSEIATFNSGKCELSIGM